MAYNRAATPWTVVSTPADSRERTISGAWVSVMSPWSAAAQIFAPNPLSVRASRAHCSFTQPDNRCT